MKKTHEFTIEDWRKIWGYAWKRFVNVVEKKLHPSSRGDLGAGEHIQGMAAELGAAQMTGQPFNPNVHSLDTLGGDVGVNLGWQVKSVTGGKSHLIIKKGKYPPTDIFILIHVCHERATALGWMYGHQAMKEEFWRDNTTKLRTIEPAYWVPSHRLNAWQTFPGVASCDVNFVLANQPPSF